MRRLPMLLVATAALSTIVLLPTNADAGCYRLGETGYHWYRFCLGSVLVLPFSTHTSASAGMATAGTVRARQA